MKILNALAVAGIFLASAIPASAEIVSWINIVGIDQPGNVVGSFANPPVCPIQGQGCVKGADEPWSDQPETISKKPQVTVDTVTGNLKFFISGLVLEGGNEIGDRPEPFNTLIGTIICINPPPGANVIINTQTVGVNSEGDSQFSGSVGPLPPSCSFGNMHFLIRTSSTGPWIANGAIRVHGVN